MAVKPKNKHPNYISFGRIVENRSARFHYFILETIEAGIALSGAEVKSLRLGRCNIEEAHAGISQGQLLLYNMNIDDYPFARHDQKIITRRPRNLLLHKREVKRLIGKIKQDGVTLIPLELFFNPQGRAKLLLGLGKGKKFEDKRETIKQRQWDREKGRILKNSL